MTQLTTLTKVKLALGITNTDSDVLLTDYINQVSAFISSLCGGRNFEAVERTEIYDVCEGTKVFLKNYPLIADADLTVEYRTGQVGTPVWVPYTINDYYVYGEEGYLDFQSRYQNYWNGGKQALRVTYTGGFLIDWDNEGDILLHNLPADITGLCTALVMNMFNTSGTASGVKSESTEGQSVTYTDVSSLTLTGGQSSVVARYMRYLV